MLIPTLTRRQQGRPVDFGRWRERRVSATHSDVADWPLDAYAVTLVGQELRDGADAAIDRVRGSLLALRIFPSNLVTLWADTPDGRAAEGATVLQRITLGPLTFLSAVRVVGLQDEHGARRRFALTWATLEGHPERGVETFAVESPAEGAIALTIHARSRPASLLVKLGSPLARRLQRRYSRAALDRLAAAARDGSQSPGPETTYGSRTISG